MRLLPAKVAHSRRSLAEHVERRATRYPGRSASYRSKAFACRAIFASKHGSHCGPDLPEVGNHTKKCGQTRISDNELAVGSPRNSGRRFAGDQHGLTRDESDRCNHDRRRKRRRARKSW